MKIIKKGDWFRCIKSTHSHRKSFIEGNYYNSAAGGCITCENGNRTHSITGDRFKNDHFVKLYSIQDLEDRKVAIINDGTLEELYSVMKAANGYTINKNYVPCRYYYRGSENESPTKWHGGHVTELPIQSVKDFLVQLPKGKRKGLQFDLNNVSQATKAELGEIGKARTNDPINPDHYKSYSVETINMMVAIYGREKTAIHCELTAFKYRQRLGKKDSIEQDLAKEKWYLEKAGELRQSIGVTTKVSKMDVALHIGIPVEQLEIIP